jgi:hypothetical protein
MPAALPTGLTALHPDWPEGRFTVSGLFAFDPLLVNYLHIVEKQFGVRPPVDFVHGAPAVIWNAGRVSANALDAARFRVVLENLYARNVGVFLTFTNHLLDQGDLGDGACNFLLDVVAKRPDLSGVIVSSDLLAGYIARRHPALRQVASITKVSVEGKRGDVGYYEDLGKRFWRYIVHPDDVHDPRVLERLDRGKAEIIVNEHCRRECPMRPEHYERIAAAQRAGPRGPLPPGKVPIPLCDTCLLVESGAGDAGGHQRSCALSTSELKAIYGMGFRHFKLQGRAAKLAAFCYDLARYTLEPDFAQPFAYLWMINKVAKGEG